ncbi:hypothetical protein NW759_016883 [Fusarium solani]|nr:hypothetical protein NW759_016883 [Fusarium solani]
MFQRTLIVFQPDERLSVAIYIPKKIERSRDCLIDNIGRLFAFPHSQGTQGQNRLALPTKMRYQLYCDGNAFQLFENKRSNSWVYIARPGNNDEEYRNIQNQGDRRRKRQDVVDQGKQAEVCASIALDKFSTRLQTHIGRVNRAPVTAAKVKAVFRPELRHLKDIVIFPCTGDEPLAQRLSGGDYDGDRAWICWDPDMVNNFEGVDVPPKPSFEKYFLPNTRQLGDLISCHGKTHFLDRLLEEAFALHLAPTFIGICTSHKEKLAYHKNSISEKSVINLSWLLSDLVDQDKSAFVFNEDIWRRIKREMGGGMLDLAPPAYKANTIRCFPETCHIIDYLKFQPL